MKTFQHLLANLGQSPQVRGRQFERICKWFLENEPGYRSQLKRAWLWDDWPDAWAPDAGIDLVAEATNGDLWAIQAKAYSEDRSITKRDVDTFLSESSRPQFAFRLLIATTNEIGRTAERTLKDQEKPVGRLLLSDLERYELDWPGSPADLRPVKPKPKKPRPHQREAIDAVLSGFEENDRGRLIMACGTGKTLVGLWVAEELQSERTLVLLPSLSLLAQTLREWTANAKRPFAFLPVCSDETVRGADQWVANTSELGFPVTTDPAEIAAFLDAGGPNVVFSTYQSSPRIAEALERSGVSFDLAIADEAHRCAGPVSSDFATILDNGAIRAERRLFQTATPRYFTDRVRKVAGEAEYEIASMDDESHFGPELHCLSFGEAIERDLLSDYQVVIVGVDDPTYREYVERGTLVTRDGKEITDARYLASQIALAKAMRDYDLHRTISFHSRVKRAREFAQELADVVAWMPEGERPSGNLWCEHVHGKMPSGKRDRRLKKLRELDQTERGLLTNARCLGEGVDVPTLDGVAFIDPRSSQVDIIQAVGRAIRKADDKKMGTVVLPVFIDDSDDPDESLRSSAFQPIWGVLKALRAHDEQLATELDDLRQARDWRTRVGHSWPAKLVLDLPAHIDISFSESIRTQILDRVAARSLLTIAQILVWADAHFDDNAEWPHKNSGAVPGAPGEKWANIDAALGGGFRGLTGGSSLSQLLLERRGVTHHLLAPRLTEDQVLLWADAFFARNETWPQQGSGEIPEVPGENWRRVNDSLVRGLRGFAGGSSLHRLLVTHRSKADTRYTNLTESRILAWADAHAARTGSWPGEDTGHIAGTSGEAWGNIDMSLRRGGRGLPGGSSLPEFLAVNRGVTHHKRSRRFTIAEILRRADQHHTRIGDWPTQASGRVRDGEDTDWLDYDRALRRGLRGLPGGSSLARLLAEERGIRNRGGLPELSADLILGWADTFYRNSRGWPSRNSGHIPGTDGDTWAAVNYALREGRRGLPGGSSLAKLLDEHRRKKD